MSMDTPVVLGPEHPWKRLLAMVAFGAVGYMLVPLILLLAVAQFGFHLWSGSSNTRLAHLGDTIRAFLWAILDFLLYRTDLPPVPVQSDPIGFDGGEHRTPRERERSATRHRQIRGELARVPPASR